jgi:MFS family permease
MSRTERTYYLVLGCYSVAAWFIAPVYPLFLLSLGLDLLQVNLVLAAYLITSCLFEVPTGAFADVAGRKLSFVLSCVVRCAAFVLYASAHDFADCLIAEVVDAIGTTLANGALDAWAVDGMHGDGQLGASDRLFARGQMVVGGSMVFGGVLSGYVAERGFALAWLLGAAGFAIAAVVGVLAMVETRPAGTARWATAHRSLGRTAVEGLHAVRGAPVLLLLCLLSLASAFAGMPINMLWQARVTTLTGQGPWLMGWIWSGLSLVFVLANAVLPRLLDRFARERVLLSTALCRAAGLALAALAMQAAPVVGGLVAYELGFGMSLPLMQAWANEHVDAERRATVLSVRSMFFTLGGALGLACLGLVARDFGISTAWLVSALLFALTVPGFVLLGQVAGRVTARPIAVPGLAK